MPCTNCDCSLCNRFYDGEEDDELLIDVDELYSEDDDPFEEEEE